VKKLNPSSTRHIVTIKAVICPGDHIYYCGHNRDTIPAIVRQVRNNRLLIAGNFLKGDRQAWVKSKNCELQRPAKLLEKPPETKDGGES